MPARTPERGMQVLWVQSSGIEDVTLVNTSGAFKPERYRLSVALSRALRYRDDNIHQE